MGTRRLFLYLAAALILTACRREFLVTEVIDGDTFTLSTGERVRIIGINTPEMSEPGGDIAKDIATQLLLGQKVRLQRDVRDKDDYDRLLRYVFIGPKFINAELVRMGYAESRFYPPDTLYQRKFESLEKTAIRNRRGLWSFPVFQAPDTSGRVPQETLLQVTSGEIITWRDARLYYGQVRTVEGKIVVSNNTGKVCFLNFDRNWKENFTAVIFSGDYAKFPPNPEDYYLNRKVRVNGLIKEFKGKPEIIVKSPEQIEIIK
jgi:micrococcal nuclease